MDQFTFHMLFFFLLIADANVYISCSKSLNAYRLVQYEINNTQYGSQYSSLNYIGCYFKSDCLRKIALVPLNEIKSYSEIDNILNSTANAILFIIPNNTYSENNNEFNLFLNEFQINLSNKTLYLPIYFTYENEAILSSLNYLKNEFAFNSKQEKKNFLDYLGISQNFLYFSLKIKDPILKNTLILENFYGFLEAKSKTESVNPIIAIVTHYDNFGIVNELTNGINDNGSGIIALLELIRTLSKYYENNNNNNNNNMNEIKYDILFLLTSAGNLNFEGTNYFLNNLEPQISDNLQYVLCLDSIGDLNEKNLYMHLSRFPKEEEFTPNLLYEIFNKTAKKNKIGLNYEKKKIYLSNVYVPWQHEQFSKKKILSATLSSKKSINTDNNFNRVLINDNELNKKTLIKNIKFIAESILTFLFTNINNNNTVNVINRIKNDEDLVDENNINRMINNIKNISRYPINIEKNSKFNNDLFKYFNGYLHKVKRQNFEYNEIKFYENNSGEIKIYNVKSKMIDLYLLIGILIYLLIIYIYTKGIKNFIVGLKESFESDSDY